jgi:hypothetical protein
VVLALKHLDFSCRSDSDCYLDFELSNLLVIWILSSGFLASGIATFPLRYAQGLGSPQ